MSTETYDDLALLNRPENVRTVRAVIRRIIARLEAGEPIPSVVIPADKAEFPKVLCLDKNKWIDLARSHYGRPDGEEFRDALAAIRHAVASQKLIVPIQGSNLAEVSQALDEGRRRRLAEFMVELSGNCSMVNPRPLRRCELKHALAAMLLGMGDGRCPRERTVHRGVFAALGKQPSSEDPLLQHALFEPELAVLLMVDAMDRASVQAMRELDKRAAAVAEAARNLDQATRRRAEFRALFASGTTADLLLAVADELDIDREALWPWLDANLILYAESVPGIDVPSRLLLARDRNRDHKTHHNDLMDFAFLEVAIPYGNVVVTENSWSHLANVERLGDRYVTTILADARRLPEILATEGCL